MSTLRAHAEVQVIVNPASSVSSMTAKELGDIFLGRKKTMEDGSKADPVDFEGESQTEFLQVYVGRSESQYRTHWKKVVFTGQGKPPHKFTSEADVIAYVAANAGAIGYVSSSADVSGVKVVSVN
jgi:ABC-type phosphate transport system substrate-binding protein